MSEQKIDEAQDNGPLHPTGWGRLWELVGKAERGVDEHQELAVLHERATAFVDEWRPDGEAAARHMINGLTAVTQALRYIADVVPAAAGASRMIHAALSAVEGMKAAVDQPGPPPPLPEPPAAVEPEPAPVPPEQHQPDPEGPQQDHS
jgi:hypothetical protein